MSSSRYGEEFAVKAGEIVLFLLQHPSGAAHNTVIRTFKQLMMTTCDNMTATRGAARVSEGMHESMGIHFYTKLPSLS